MRDSLKQNITLDAILNTAVDGIIIINKMGIISLINPAVMRLFGYAEEELIGQNISILMPEPDHSQHNGYIDRFLSTGEKKIIGIGREVRGRQKNGDLFPFNLSVSEMEIDGETMFTGVIHDITDQKKIQKELEELNTELEERVEERTKQVQDALNKERQLNEMKSRFVSMASHEFRTPLGTILSSVSLIERYNTPENADRKLKHVERIKSSVKNLTTILDDFLSLDKLETGRLEVHLRAIDIQQTTQEIVDDIQTIASSGQELTYTHEGLKEWNTDLHMYKNILINLLSNAVKYSEEPVEVMTTCTPMALQLKVKDKGIGIPDEDQEMMFNRFFRAKNAMNIQGTGLGLNIVKKYLDLLHGNIYFESEQGKGTTFTVELPMTS